jgi:hypothetical protein
MRERDRFLTKVTDRVSLNWIGVNIEIYEIRLREKYEKQMAGIL